MFYILGKNSVLKKPAIRSVNRKSKKIDMSALEAIWKKNLKIRKNRDWEHMNNAFGRGASNNNK